MFDDDESVVDFIVLFLALTWRNSFWLFYRQMQLRFLFVLFFVSGSKKFAAKSSFYTYVEYLFIYIRQWSYNLFLYKIRVSVIWFVCIIHHNLLINFDRL